MTRIFQWIFSGNAWFNMDFIEIMLYLDYKSYEEMEDVLGISMGTLRVKMNRIKEKLRQITKTSQYGT